MLHIKGKNITISKLHFKGYMCLCLFICLLQISCGSDTPDAPPPITQTQLDSLALISINTGTIKWNQSSPIEQWQGVGVEIVDGQRRVVFLDLHDSQLSGKIPSAITELTALEYLDLSGNLLSENITNLSALTRLQVLDLHNNNLSGVLPDHFTSLKNLTYLSLGKNSFYGEVTEKISQLNKLIVLDLAEQKNSISNPGFSGNIPSSWTTLTNLKYLYLHKNSFSGRIPQYFTSFNKLIHLTMDDNNLIGEIPSGFGNIASLEYLSMKKNSLTGSIPSDLLLNPNWEQWKSQIIEQQGGSLKNQTSTINEIKYTLPDKRDFYRME